MATIKEELEPVRDLLDDIDPFIMSVIARRLEVARDVGLVKSGHNGAAVVDEDREDSQMIAIEKVAGEVGINSHFARAVLYGLIRESCKTQDKLIHSRDVNFQPLLSDSPEVQAQKLRHNLLVLTGSVASTYDVNYGKDSAATRIYRAYEDNLILRTAEACDPSFSALDLGCATGPVSWSLNSRFQSVTGFDISPKMIRFAGKQNPNEQKRPTFIRWDLENGIDSPDESASLVVMNLGTASEIRNVEQLFADIRRVLIRGGKAFLSFYNRTALMHQVPMPWLLPLAANYDPVMSCLWVKNRAIYAKLNMKEEIQQLLSSKGGLTPIDWFSYPTIGSILPSAVLDHKEMRKLIQEIDLGLSPQMRGAYIILVCIKE